MPAILPFVLQFVIPAITAIFSIIIAVLPVLLVFTVKRAVKIPRYIHLIQTLYSDMSPGSKERKIVTVGLLIIGGIVTFMAYSAIPFTSLPLIGSITTPVAASLAIVVALVMLDFIFSVNEGYYRDRCSQNTAREIEHDINELKQIFGSSWKELVKVVKNSTNTIYEEGKKYGINFDGSYFTKYLDYQIRGVELYVRDTQNIDINDANWTEFKHNQEQEWMKDAYHLGAGASVGSLAGVGASSLVSSFLVPASFWTTLQGVFGVSTGVVVSASAYSLLTVAAPVGLGVIATLGIYSGLNTKSHKDKAEQNSKFISEIIMAALPMAWIDNEFSEQELDIIERLMTTSGIRQQEREKIYKEIKERKTFDDVMKTDILFDTKYQELYCRQSEKERIKHRLMLCVAWQIALADEKIHDAELHLHNRMAKKLGVSSSEVQEIRRTMSFQHHQELWESRNRLNPSGE
ncbi:MAG: TerB family tellurite resistance protein [Jaaginema sp. PMC 1079.18]|nr:TerB family tellurite resistance protein [Jaaginema sp. PMC 1080.18]MEC4851421.1 TerB family tellurite resistance protein [Jaaginema sp. PMC 1079.18]MEC4866199.1 TerB family tellurite resistance protein [Jaaginema sp. PMC 1078.18]